MQKGLYFYINCLIFLVTVFLTAPLFSHASENPLFLGYSRRYLIYLILYTTPVLVFLWLILRRDPVFNRNLCLIVLTTFLLSEAVARILMSSKAYQDEEYRYAKPYVMFSGKPNVEFVDNGALMGATQSDDRMIRLNEFGFRGEIPPAKKTPQEYRIFMLGGSTVFNGAPLSRTIAGQVEELFHQKGMKNVKVYNWGVVSYVSGQELSLLLHTVVNYEPDAVIVYDGANDIYQPYYYDPRPGYPYNFLIVEVGLSRIENRASIIELVSSILYKSKALALIYRSSLQDQIAPIGRIRQEIGNFRSEEWEKDIVNVYEGNLKKMCRLAEAYDFKAAFILQPMIHFKTPLVGHEAQFDREDAFRSYLVRQFGRARDGLVQVKGRLSSDRCVTADLSGVFKNDERELFWDMVHINNDGNAVVAGEIYNVLESAGFGKK